MTGPAPHVVVLGGPNGAGKSTTAHRLLVGALRVDEFVNADVIAQGISAFRPDVAAIDAGRVMLRRLRQLAQRRVNFAYETTMASRTFAPWLTELRDDGYAIHLIYLWLPSVDLAIARVAERVKAGGHDVPEATIRRRFRAGLRNFLRLYRPLADSWRLYDNSDFLSPRLLARQTGRSMPIVVDATLWRRIEEGDRSE